MDVIRRVRTAALYVGRGFLSSLEAMCEVMPFAEEFRFASDVRSRPPMDDETFFRTYYKSSGIAFEIPTTVRRIYGEQLGHDPLRLRADDFDPAIWDIDTVELVMEVEDAFGEAISDDEAEATSGSIDSIIQLIARKRGWREEKSAKFTIEATGTAPTRRTASSA